MISFAHWCRIIWSIKKKFHATDMNSWELSLGYFDKTKFWLWRHYKTFGLNDILTSFCRQVQGLQLHEHIFVTAYLADALDDLWEEIKMRKFSLKELLELFDRRIFISLFLNFLISENNFRTVSVLSSTYAHHTEVKNRVDTIDVGGPWVLTIFLCCASYIVSTRFKSLLFRLFSTKLTDLRFCMIQIFCDHIYHTVIAIS